MKVDINKAIEAGADPVALGARPVFAVGPGGGRAIFWVPEARQATVSVGRGRTHLVVRFGPGKFVPALAVAGWVRFTGRPAELNTVFTINGDRKVSLEVSLDWHRARHFPDTLMSEEDAIDLARCYKRRSKICKLKAAIRGRLKSLRATQANISAGVRLRYGRVQKAKVARRKEFDAEMARLRKIHSTLTDRELYKNAASNVAQARRLRRALRKHKH